MSGYGRRRNQGSRNHSGNGATANGGNADPGKVPYVELRNWNQASMSEVLSFIQRRTRIHLQDPKQANDVLSARVTPDEARELSRLDDVRFSGRRLDVKISYRSPEASATMTILKAVLQQRYNPAAKLLNFAGLMSDPGLAQNRLLDNPQTATKMFKALLHVASEEKCVVESVSLEGNMLSNLELPECLATTFPKLLNLSLANNQIQGMAPFTRLRNKFTVLRELVLAGNPMQQNPSYQNQVRELVAMFPRLVILDGIPVRNEAELPRTSLPAPIMPTFFEDENVASVTQAFLASFFQLWDSDRSGLLPLYDAASFFSVALDGSAPHKPGPSRTTTNYVPFSRNLARNAGQQSRHARINLGPSQVATAFNKFPKTRHDLSNAAAFAIDAWKISDVRAPGDAAILMVVHGQFEEVASSRAVRSFDRSLVVLPGPQGYIVASDLLTVRMHAVMPVSNGDLAAPGPVPAPPVNANPMLGAPNVGVPNPGMPNPGMPNPGMPNPGMPNPGMPNVGVPNGVIGSGLPAQAAPPPSGMPSPDVLLQEFMRQTGLTMEFAEMCLKQANLDPNVAMQLFQQSRAQLPPHAFITP